MEKVGFEEEQGPYSLLGWSPCLVMKVFFLLFFFSFFYILVFISFIFHTDWKNRSLHFFINFVCSFILFPLLPSLTFPSFSFPSPLPQHRYNHESRFLLRLPLSLFTIFCLIAFTVYFFLFFSFLFPFPPFLIILSFFFFFFFLFRPFQQSICYFHR